MYPEDLKYTKTHEWAKLDDDIVTVGVTQYAVEQLKDIVYIDLPDVGDDLLSEVAFAEIESVKTVADVFSPVDGTVVEINQLLEDKPETLSQDPYVDGWIVKLQVTDTTQLDPLMTAEDYEKHVESEEEREDG